MIDAIAELFFLSDRSDHSDCSDHMENGLKLLHKQPRIFPCLFQASPPQSALLALRRVSASRVIPFKEVGHEIAAMVNEPRNVYPRDTLQQERLVLFNSDTGKCFSVC